MGGASFRNVWIQDLNPCSQEPFSPYLALLTSVLSSPSQVPFTWWPLAAPGPCVLPVEGSQQRERALFPKVLAKMPMQSRIGSLWNFSLGPLPCFLLLHQLLTESPSLHSKVDCISINNSGICWVTLSKSLNLPEPVCFSTKGAPYTL